MNNSIKSISNIYKNISNFGKVLIFITLFLILIVLFKSVDTSSKEGSSKEGYTQNDSFLFKRGGEIYDEFYVDIYDHLVFNNLKDDYEI